MLELGADPVAWWLPQRWWFSQDVVIRPVQRAVMS